MGNDPSPAYFPFHPKRCRANPETPCSNGSTLSRGGLHLCNILVTPLILLLEVGWQQVYAATDIERHVQSLACRIVFRNGAGPHHHLFGNAGMLIALTGATGFL